MITAMKAIKKIAIPLLVILVCAAIFIACNSIVDEDDSKETVKVIREPEYITLLADGSSAYTIIRPEVVSDEAKQAAMDLRDAFKEKFGASPSLGTDWLMRGTTVEEGALEILVGDTNREETAIVKNSLDGVMYGIAVIDDKVVICATSDEYLADAVKCFIDTYIKPVSDGTVLIEKTTSEIAIKSDNGWLMARTLAVEVAATSVKSVSDGKATIEVIAAIDATDYADIGFNIELTTSSAVDKRTVGEIESKGEEYTSGGVTYKASDYGKGEMLAVEIGDIDASSLTKISVEPYLVKFGDTYYGLSAFACLVDGECETISTINVKDGVYQLTNAAELHVFGNYVNNGHRALNASVTSDIDLGGTPWTPIGTYGISYKGTFEGGGHKISGLCVDMPEATCAGFFGCVGSSGVIKDIEFKDAYVTADSNESVGIVAGENRGLITGCKAGGTVSTAKKDGKATGSYSDDSSLSGIGGIVGTLNGRYKSSVEDSEFTGKIEVSGKNISFVGGIAGRSIAISGDIIRCVNSGVVNVSTDINTVGDKTVMGVGGIAGSILNAEIFASVNNGSVTGEGSAAGVVGGIVGNVIGMGQVVECHNDGKVSSSFTGTSYTKGYAGGIIGTFSGKTITDGMVLRCYNAGEVTGIEGTYCGGIIGLGNECRAYIFYSYNVGKIDSPTYAGGIAGGAGTAKTFIMSCYNAGDVIAKNAGGIIGFTFTSYSDSYKTSYFDDDRYLIYNNNSYLSTKTENACGGNHENKDGAAETVEALEDLVLELGKVAPNGVEAHEYFVSDTKNINGGCPIFEYQNDASKADPEVAIDLYRNHSVTIEPDGSLYYYANRYTDYMEDNGMQITVAEFESKMNETGESVHKVVDENGDELSECSCTVFGKDHHFSISKWQQILEDVNDNLQGVADWANRGEIRWIGHLIADAEQSSGSVAVTWRLTGDSTTLSINFNVIYYKNERCSGATVHEMAHSQLLDGPCASWVAEGSADYVKYNYYTIDNGDLVNYKWKSDDLMAAYTPTASCLTWLTYQYGYKSGRIALTFDTVLTGDALEGWKLAFGAEYKEIWELFGAAGKYNKTAYFED